MNKIISLEQIPSIVNELHHTEQVIVLAGGCFDILHTGHIEFLEAAKKQGDSLWVMLESDETIRKRKGENKPVNTQTVRATILASLPSVDYIILLADHMTHADYDKVVLAIKPAIIATTKGDPGEIHKKRQADMLASRVVEVIERLPAHSSSILAENIL